MKKRILFCVVFLIAVLLPVSAQDNVRKTALVIGNAAYKGSLLKNPANDARGMAGALRQLGFNVKLYVNADYKSMYDAIRSFGRELSRGGVGLFYYAGHGMQVKGTNYLIPVGADIAEEDEVRFNAVDANLVLSKMESAGNRTNIVILDACRDNPFSRSFRSASRGLAVVDAPRGSLVVYATAPGSVSADGSGKNGIFTGALLKHIRESGIDIEMMLREVRRDVMAETNNAQIPWSSSSLTGNFYFRGSGKGVKMQGTSVSAETAAAPSIKSGTGKGTLFIKTEPLGARVIVNGEDKGESPVLLDNMPLYTPLTVEAKKGNMYAKKEVSLKKQELTEVALSLEVLKGSLFIKTEERDVSVYIDGKNLGEIGAGLFKDIPAGSHKVELKGNLLYWKGNAEVLKDRVAVVTVRKMKKIEIAIGASYAGGIVFYLNGSGGGLAAAPTDQGEYTWNDAKRVCDNLVLNGYNDWYLPSKEELNLMYNNLKRKGLGGFAGGSYWSSSESSLYGAWRQAFDGGGGQNLYSKDYDGHVRAVRAF